MAEEEEVLRLQQQGTLRKHCPQYLFSIDIYLFHNIIDNGVIRYLNIIHTGNFPRGVGHRVENGWVLTKVAVVLLNGLIW